MHNLAHSLFVCVLIVSELLRQNLSPQWHYVNTQEPVIKKELFEGKEHSYAKKTSRKATKNNVIIIIIALKIPGRLIIGFYILLYLGCS